MQKILIIYIIEHETCDTDIQINKTQICKLARVIMCRKGNPNKFYSNFKIGKTVALIKLCKISTARKPQAPSAPEPNNLI